MKTAEGAFWSELVLDRGALGRYRLDELSYDFPVLRVVPVDLVSLEVVEVGHHGELEVPLDQAEVGSEVEAPSAGSRPGSRLSSAATCCFCSSVASGVQQNITTCLIDGPTLPTPGEHPGCPPSMEPTPHRTPEQRCKADAACASRCQRMLREHDEKGAVVSVTIPGRTC